MLQVVGGTDRLPAAFAARLKDRIEYRAAVREIRQIERGVSVVYADQKGRVQRAEAERRRHRDSHARHARSQNSQRLNRRQSDCQRLPSRLSRSARGATG